jgi:hypothetical protein
MSRAYDQAHVVHKPCLLSDNSPNYVSGDLAEWLQGKGMKHTRGALYMIVARHSGFPSNQAIGLIFPEGQALANNLRI